MNGINTYDIDRPHRKDESFGNIKFTEKLFPKMMLSSTFQ